MARTPPLLIRPSPTGHHTYIAVRVKAADALIGRCGSLRSLSSALAPVLWAGSLLAPVLWAGSPRADAWDKRSTDVVPREVGCRTIEPTPSVA